MSATIYAVSSGAPPAAIAIIRISGEAAFAVACTLAGSLPQPRRAALRPLRDPRDGTLIDRALVLTFPTPATATGDDVVELHVHGGRAVVDAVVAALAAFPQTRPAEAGEFTRRALENGVIDLTAAEGLADLLTAQTETQRRAALRMSEGGVRVLIDSWNQRLVALAARVEAQLDFSDEDDVPSETITPILSAIEAIAVEIERVLAAPTVERLHDGIRVVIAGPPNSGKSTLLNTLAQRDVAIVSTISGTTRDRIEAPVVRGGIAYLLTDTAGLTKTPGDEIERIGVERAHDAIGSADVIVWLGEPGLAPDGAIRAHSRIDILPVRDTSETIDLAFSAVTLAGIDTLWDLIQAHAQRLLPTEDRIAVNRRQQALLRDCSVALGLIERDQPDLLQVSEALRICLRNLDLITGRSGVEEVLDSIFGNFCIGK